MNLRLPTSYIRALIAILLLSGLVLSGSLAAQAESLVSVTTSQLPPLPESDRISRVLVIDEQAIALGESAAWRLDDAEQQWQRLEGRPSGSVSAVAYDGQRTFLLLVDAVDPVDVKVVELSLSSGGLQSEALPPLPESLLSSNAAVLEGQLFIAGTTADGEGRLFAIDLLRTDETWQRYDAWTGASGPVTSMLAQNLSLLITTRLITTRLITSKDAAHGGERLLQWNQDSGWQQQSGLAGNVVEGTGQAVGQGHAIYLVAADSNAGSPVDLMSYHTITKAWASHGSVDAPRVSSGTAWKDGVLWSQTNAEGGAAEFAFTEIESGQLLLAPLDWSVIVVYLLGMLGVGLYFYTRDAQKSEAEFFLGSRSIPFWAAGISLYVSNASSISYIAVPAKAFATNWQYLLSNIIVVLGLMFVAVWIVPLLRRLNLMSIFHYLETRFHPSIRVLSSALYIVFQLAGRMTIILFLPSLAISTVTGIDVTLSILVMGGVTIVYTVLGGMKAVIWTDFVQLFVMFGGMFFAIGFILTNLDGGIGEFFSTALMDDKLKMVDWSFDLTEATIWGFMFLILFDTVLTFPKDQVLMQRVLATSSAKEAGRSVWTFALIVLPASVIFYFIGTALYVFYQSHPERMDPSLTIDATFPLFIAAELPVGVTGLIIAGIFAASMSTLSSILNSVATLSTVDFYEKITGSVQTKKSLRFAEITTIVAGVIGISLALLLSRYEVPSLLDLALELWGLLGGGFAGAYTLGMFTRRANWQGVAIGVTVSIAVTLYAWFGDMVHPYFYLPVSIFVCIVVGYAASWLFPAPASVKGLTVFKQDAIADTEKTAPV